MNFEQLSEEWRATNNAVATVEQREQLIATTCRRVERLGGVVLRRDLIETVAGLIVIVFFGRFCLVSPADYVVSKSAAAFLVCWALFVIYKMHRTRTITKPAPLDAPVREFCRIELDRLDRQIQLLRSVLWWYIAPCIVAVNVMFVALTGLGSGSLVYCLSTFLLAAAIYGLNMIAVAKSLIPPRNELARMLSQLGGDDVAPIEQPVARWSIFRSRFSVMVMLVAFAGLFVFSAFLLDHKVEYPKRAPYASIRWEGDKPVVKIGEQWFTLVSIDGIPAEDIVAFSWRTYVDRWRMRFEEDLVEVLTRMGHPPKDTVTLVASPLGSSTTRTFEDVPMTEANRWAIKGAAMARERAK